MSATSRWLGRFTVYSEPGHRREYVGGIGYVSRRPVLELSASGALSDAEARTALRNPLTARNLEVYAASTGITAAQALADPGFHRWTADLMAARRTGGDVYDVLARFDTDALALDETEDIT